MNHSKTTLRNVALSAMIAAGMTPMAHALEVEAGDYEVYPQGVNIGILYYSHHSIDSYYANGHKVYPNFKLNLDAVLVRDIQVVGLTPTINIEPQAILLDVHHDGKDNAAGLGSGNNYGDLVLGAPVKWLLNTTTHDAFSIGPFIYLPVGNYDRSKPFNGLAAHRVQGLLQLAYVTHFNPSWALDVISDVTVKGTNSNSDLAGDTIKTAPTYEEQAHLRYNITPATFVAADYGVKFGGNDSINGVSQNNRLRTQYGRVTATSFITQTFQLSGQLGADLKADNGVREKLYLQLRAAKIF